MSNITVVLWSISVLLSIIVMTIGYNVGYKEGCRATQYNMRVDAVRNHHGYFQYVSGKGLEFTWFNLDHHVCEEEIDGLFNAKLERSVLNESQ